MILINIHAECPPWAQESFDKFTFGSDYTDRPQRYLGKEGACHVFAVAMKVVDDSLEVTGKEKVLIHETENDPAKLDACCLFSCVDDYIEREGAIRRLQQDAFDELFDIDALVTDERPLSGIAIFKIFKQGIYLKERARNLSSNFGFGPRKIYGTYNYMVVCDPLGPSSASRSTVDYLLDSECHIALDQIDLNHIWFGWHQCKSHTYVSPSVADFALAHRRDLASKARQLEDIVSGGNLRKSLHQRLLCDCITTPQWSCVVGSSKFRALPGDAQDYILRNLARLDVLTLVSNDHLQSFREKQASQDSYFVLRKRDPQTGILVDHVRVGLFQDTDDCPAVIMRENCFFHREEGVCQII